VHAAENNTKETHQIYQLNICTRSVFPQDSVGAISSQNGEKTKLSKVIKRLTKAKSDFKKDLKEPFDKLQKKFDEQKEKAYAKFKIEEV
jgi:hypothetical protein